MTLAFEKEIIELLSTDIEPIIFEDFNKFKKESGESDINSYIDSLLKGNYGRILTKYPVLEKIIAFEERCIKLKSLISSTFISDKKQIYSSGLLKSSVGYEMLSIETNLGDFHNGKSTSLINIKDDNKIIYKPSNGGITFSYNQFLKYINFKNDDELKLNFYNILGRTDYHWIEFVKQESFENIKQLKEYYKKIGVLICIVYILNGLDFHYENIISTKDSPILIDHETVIQPLKSSKLSSFFKFFNDDDTVLKSFLLPSKVSSGQLPIGMCGLGWHKQKRTYRIKLKSTDRLTNNWKMSAQFFSLDLFKKNIPIFNNERIYPIEYLSDIVSGFEICYNFFLSEKKFLLSINSPIKAFENKTIRFIWRPTNVYTKINEVMKLPKNLIDMEEYKRTIEKYLFTAYKKVPKTSNLLLIYKHEVTQMLRGDIPYFIVNSSSRDLITEHGIVKDFFELSAVENIKRKLNKLSLEDLEYQKKLIIESITG